MKDYLNSLVYEQISRSESLKKRIEKPLPYPELSGLKERINKIIDEQTMILSSCLSELQERQDDSDCRDILRIVRGSVRVISDVETYGIAALEYQTRESAFLNKVLFKIHQEIKLPLSCPSVCCISTNYYFSVPFANVIFVPLLESDFLLHLPDLYHEIGHLVARNRESMISIQNIKESFEKAFSKITDYYTELIKEKKKDVGPEEILQNIAYIHAQWKLWIEEFFCDLFGLYTLGPAYVWSNLHLTTKTSPDIHRLLVIIEQSHPSDEARMRMLFVGLRLLGFETEAEPIKTEWNKVKPFWGSPSPEYQYAYPDPLLQEIAQIFLEGIKESGFSIVKQESLQNDNENVRFLLNQAWKNFWKLSSEDFRIWETEQIDLLRKNLITA
ncbi:MAG: hypothetical protein ACREBI_02920 [Nitrosotalea sp.]